MSFATVVIDNPGGEGNLLNPGVIAAVIADLTAADADETIAGAVITGAGEIFCAGLDIPAIQAGGDPVEFAAALAELLKLLPTLGMPVVAAVNGDAVASGASIVAACDYAVCLPHARIGTREVSVGIWPMVAQVPLIHRIGVRFAMENIGSGEPFTPQRALEVGLINEITDAAGLLPAAEAWLTKAARGGAITKVGRPAFYRLAELGYSDALDASVELFAEMNRR